MTNMELFIKNLLEKNYDLGIIVAVSEIKKGDTNNSYIVTVNNDGTMGNWYVRQYNQAVTEGDVIYEHAFERYFSERVNGEIQTLLPQKTKNGNTWVKAKHDEKENYYAVFNIIRGNETYSWEFNDLSDVALESCAEITGKFHAWGYGFVPPEGANKAESPLEDQFDEWKEAYRKGLQEKREEPEVFRRFTEYFEKEVDELCDLVDYCHAEFLKHKDDLKKCVNHKDLSPGNVMFDDDDRVNAVFDMDWCNEDYRLYDIGWMAHQVLTSWDVRTWGQIPIEKLDKFIDSYDRVMAERECPLGLLNQSEKEFMPVMLIIGILKILADFALYEEHHHDADRLFISTWRFVETVKFMKKYVDSKVSN